MHGGQNETFVSTWGGFGTGNGQFKEPIRTSERRTG